jgi:uncharacterized protein
LLVDAGADLNAANEDGMTPLLIAAINGHAEIVKSLIARGTNINAASYDGITPVEVA